MFLPLTPLEQLRSRPGYICEPFGVCLRAEQRNGMYLLRPAWREHVDTTCHTYHRQHSRDDKRALLGVDNQQGQLTGH